jgi:hypothetical protein
MKDARYESVRVEDLKTMTVKLSGTIWSLGVVGATMMETLLSFVFAVRITLPLGWH